MEETQSMVNPEKKYDSIGGFLILLAIGIVINPIRLSVSVFKDLLPVFSNPTWSALTTPDGGAYHPLWAPLLISELIVNIIFAVFSIIIAVLFFQKRKFFPKLMIIFLLSNLVFIVADHFAANLIPFVASQTNLKSFEQIAQIGIASLIWVPYLLLSSRVKGTFVN